jgi:hypothetical protein
MSRALRILGFLDLGSGVFALAEATWLADQVDLGVTAVRLIGVFLLVLGFDKVLFRDKPLMGRVSMAVEALFALACLDVAVMTDPTSIGTALLVGTAVLCASVAVWLFTLQRTRSLVTA